MNKKEIDVLYKVYSSTGTIPSVIRAKRGGSKEFNTLLVLLLVCRRDHVESQMLLNKIEKYIISKEGSDG